jgi:hypothetical protein
MNNLTNIKMENEYIWQELIEYVSGLIDKSTSEIKDIEVNKLNVDFLLYSKFYLETYMRELHYVRLCNEFLLFIGDNRCKDDIDNYLNNLMGMFKFNSTSSAIDTISQINQFGAIQIFVKQIKFQLNK